MLNKFFGARAQGYSPLRKLKVILSGLRFAVMYDFSVAYKFVVSAVVMVLALIFQQWVNVEMLLLATGLVLMAELFNSAIEAVCDFVKPEHNEQIGAIKDIAAAAVAVIMVVWLVVVIGDAAQIIRLLAQRWLG